MRSAASPSRRLGGVVEIVCTALCTSPSKLEGVPEGRGRLFRKGQERAERDIKGPKVFKGIKAPKKRR